MQKSWKKSLVLMSTMAVLVLAGCGAKSTREGKNADQVKEDNKSSEVVKKTEGTKTKKTEYPLTVSTFNSDGTELKTVYKQAPKKALAVYQGSVETLLALGLEDHIVATAGLDNAVPEDQKAAFSKTKYLDEFTPSLETVTALEPDMIFTWGSLFGEKTLGNAKDWVDKGVNTYINSNTSRSKEGQVANRTLENEYKDILTIGQIFDVQDKAESIVDNMKKIVTDVTAKAKEAKQSPKTLVIEMSKSGFTNYGKASLGGDMVTALGGTLANPDAKQLGKEDVLAANPDVIFVVYMPYTGDNAEEVKQKHLDNILKDEAYSSLDAVKNKRVIPIMLSEMYASATRTKDGIISFAKGLYPDLKLDVK